MMEMVQVKFALLLIVLHVHVCHVHTVYRTEHPSRHTRAKIEVTDTSMKLEDQVQADIWRRLSSLESDNRRLKAENQQIHKTNMDLKQEMQQILQENVRRLEIENRQCQGMIVEKMQHLEEEFQKMTKSKETTLQHEPTARTDFNRNNQFAWNVPSKTRDFPNSFPYRALKSASSDFKQAERNDSSEILYNTKEFGDYRDTGVIDSFVNDLPSKPIQTSKNGSLTSVYTTPQNTKDRSRTNKRATVASSSIAFHARLSSDVTNPGNDQPIIMSDVLTNEGSAYEKLSGHFTSPVSGVYAFFFTAVTYHDKKIELELMKNGHTIGKLVSVNRDDWGSASNAVIVTAQQGDRFWVRVNDIYHDTGTVLDHYFTTFSGFLLH